MNDTNAFTFHPDIVEERPADFEDDEGDYSAFFPREAADVSGPDGAEFVCACAWAFSRYSERREGYFIGPATTAPYAWVLWRFAFDDNWEAWSWDAYAATTGAFPNPAEAARTLLTFGWTHERERWRTSGPDEVERDGLLNAIEVQDIAARVSGGEGPGDDGQEKDQAA